MLEQPIQPTPRTLVNNLTLSYCPTDAQPGGELGAG
jgi:hypothetical protein